MLSGSDFSKGSLAEADLSFTDLREFEFCRYQSRQGEAFRTWMAGSNAEGANFSKVEAYRSDFQKVRANDANFTGAELERSNFSKAELNNAPFEKAGTRQVVDFDGAVLTGASFAFANLARADLTKAGFNGPLNFRVPSSFSPASREWICPPDRLDQHQLNMACGDPHETAHRPELPESWPCPEKD